MIAFEFYENQIIDCVIVTSFMISEWNCLYLNTIYFLNVILSNNLLLRTFVNESVILTFTHVQGHMLMSKTKKTKQSYELM